MYLLGEQPACADVLIVRLQRIRNPLLKDLMPCGEVLRFESTEDLSTSFPDNQRSHPLLFAQKEELEAPAYGRSERALGSIHRNEKTAVDLEMRIVIIIATDREIGR